MKKLNRVLITITNIKKFDQYLARSYPDRDLNNNGKHELYEVPIYEVFIENLENKKLPKKKWSALRFMPYWNDPKSPKRKFKHRGWINAGLSNRIKRKKVTYYDPTYDPQNMPTQNTNWGGIQIQGNFLIHAGPNKLNDFGWGSAGCVEIIGSFSEFRKDIKELSGSRKKNSHKAIIELVRNRKLFVSVQPAIRPNFKKKFYGEVPESLL